MSNYTLPVYSVDSKEFKTVDGLWRYLLKKHKAASTSGIGADRKLRVYKGRDTLVATYQVSPPEIGKPMILTVAA